jgi:hypothetical protein
LSLGFALDCCWKRCGLDSKYCMQQTT